MWIMFSMSIEIDIKEAEDYETRGKSLKEWALTEPHRLEIMSENEFDDKIREMMITVYRKYRMPDYE